MWASQFCSWSQKVLCSQRTALLQPCRTLASAPKSNLAKLRKSTGYSLTLCKNALAENNQDLEAAKTWLKDQALKQGWDKASKLEGRNTAQGLVGVLVKGNHASVVELNCETDFVARNKQFLEILNELSHSNLAAATEEVKPEGNEVVIKTKSQNDLAALKAKSGQSLADIVALNIGQIGENIVLRRGLTVSAGGDVKLSGVTHPSANVSQSENHVMFGRYGTVVAYTNDGEDAMPEGQTAASLARQLGQHIIGMNPKTVGSLDNLNPASKVKEEESEPANEQVEDIDAKVKALDEQSILDHSELVKQDFLLDTDTTVGQLLIETCMEVKDFVRLEVGSE